MIRDAIFTAGLAVIALLPAACTDNRSNPAAPNSVGNPSFDRAHDDDNDDDDDNDERRFLSLVSLVGPGNGRIRVTRIPHPTTPGNFAVHIEVRIRARTNTSYLVQRAAEVLPPAGVDVVTLTDGSCQRGLAIAPWSPLPAPAQTPPAFATFPDQTQMPPPNLTITTDGRGKGAADFVFAAGVPFGLFDVMFRVIEDSPAPKSVLQSDCTSVPLLS